MERGLTLSIVRMTFGSSDPPNAMRALTVGADFQKVHRVGFFRHIWQARINAMSRCWPDVTRPVWEITIVSRFSSQFPSKMETAS